MDKQYTATVEILGFGHAYNEGERGMAGGAAQNDKIWGYGRVGNTLVSFWGRRGGALRFKTFFASEKAEVEAIYASKVKSKYIAIRNESMMETLRPGLKEGIIAAYYSAMSKGKLNTNH